VQAALLRHDQQFAVGRIEIAAVIGRLAAYRWIAQPLIAAGEPLPAMVTQPSMKSVGASGIGSGLQRIWFGRGCHALVEAGDDAAVAMRWKAPCMAPDGSGTARSGGCGCAAR
jgi:hypothetical protein